MVRFLHAIIENIFSWDEILITKLFKDKLHSRFQNRFVSLPDFTIMVTLPEFVATKESVDLTLKNVIISGDNRVELKNPEVIYLYFF